MKKQKSGNIQVVTPTEIKQNFEHNAELLMQVDTLSSQCAKMAATIRELEDTVAQKEIELEHLKDMITKCAPSLTIQQIITDEEMIALKQLAFLKVKALKSELTLDELKAFDILVKNKRLFEDKSTDNVGTALLRDVSQSELLQIAASPLKKDD